MWNSIFAGPFTLRWGVHQAGMLSPLLGLLVVYVDCLADELRKSGYDSHIGFVSAGALVYVDDITLLAASVLRLGWYIRFIYTCKDQIACFGEGESPRVSE